MSVVVLPEQFVRKYAETAKYARGPEMAGMQQSMTKSQLGLESSMMNISIKFGINSQDWLSGNVWKPRKFDGWTDGRMDE